MNKLLTKYHKACYDLLEEFVKQYYLGEGIGMENVDFWWIGGQYGGVAGINDQFWNMTDIVTALELDYPEDKLFEWNEYQLEERTKEESPINLTNYLKMKV